MSDIQKLHHQLERAGIIVPPIPSSLVGSMREINPWVFSTRALSMSPFLFDMCVNEVQNGQVADYALVAHAGHGANSYAISYSVVWSGCAILLQLSWGGVYSDHERETMQVNEAFNGLHDLWPALCARMPMSPPLFAAYSDLGQPLITREGRAPESLRSSGVGGALLYLRDELGLGPTHA
jgi:hypothetical protein